MLNLRNSYFGKKTAAAAIRMFCELTTRDIASSRLRVSFVILIIFHTTRFHLVHQQCLYRVVICLSFYHS